MRRKSERVKDKDKSTEKKTDRSPKKSRRSSRRRKKSSSTSPEEESDTDDYENSFKSCKDDTEEEHFSSKSVPGKNTADIETDTPVLATEVEGKGSPQVSGSRSRRHSKKQSEEVEEKQSTGDDVNESQEKAEGADAVVESLEKHKDSENKSSMWQVKSTDCSDGEIKKLKLCIVRPPEPAEPEPRKRKKLSRMPHRETEVSPGESEGLATHDSPDEKRKSRKSASNVVEDSGSENRKRHGSEGKKSRTEDSSDDEQHRNKSSEDLPTATEVPVDKGKVEEGESIQEVNSRKKLQAGDSILENKESNTDNVVKSSRSPEEAKSAGSPDPFDTLRQGRPLKEDNLKPSSSPEISEKYHVSLKETDVNNTEIKTDASDLPQEGPKRSNSSEETPNNDSPSEKLPNTLDSSEERPKVSDSSNISIKAPDTSESMPKSQHSPSEKGDDHTGTKSKSEDALKDGQDSFTRKSTTGTDNSSEKRIEPSEKPLKKPVPRDSSDSEEERLNYRKMHESKKTSHRLTRHTSDTLPPALDTPEKTFETKATLKSSTFNLQTSHKSHDLQNSSKSTNKHTGSTKDSKHKEVPRDPPRLERKKYKSVDIHRNEKSRLTEKPQVREKVSLKRSSSRVNDASIDVQISVKGEDGDKEDGSTTVLENASIGSEPQLNLVRKRRWGASKSTIAVKKPTLSISSDSLKHLIPEVKPLPISEVQLTEDEDEEEEGEVLDKVEESFEIEAEMSVETVREEIQTNDRSDEKEPLFPLPMVPDPPEGKAGTVRKVSIISADAARLQRSPSPARHRASNVLFVTNLVRPFTVNQLRELLARTGTIVDNGFWIDKIKSKCYVQYETETEAQETRHALHGVRWPVSNPKQLCVDYAKKEDMDLARDLAEGNHIPRKTEPLKMDRMDGWLADQGRDQGRDKDREHILREDRDRERDRVRGKERHTMGPMDILEKSREAKMAVGIREWDLGKMDVGSFDERGFHREERNAGERERRIRKERSHRSPSREPPGRKIRKKDEEAPAKLLDDLFKKTKVTPCVYWLPLTADQIVVKEEMRRKHMAEHERRMAEMRKAEKAERERQRARMQGRTSQRRFDDRERDKRRHRSPSGSSKK